MRVWDPASAGFDLWDPALAGFDPMDDTPPPNKLDRLVNELNASGSGGRHAPRLAPSDVGVVRARDGEAELRPRDERHVGQVGAAGVRVVENEDVVP